MLAFKSYFQLWFLRGMKNIENTKVHIDIFTIQPATPKEDLDFGCVIYYDNIKIFRSLFSGRLITWTTV